MSNSSSTGLFVLLATVIFGIFVLISYLLFRDKLAIGLSDIFDDSISSTLLSVNQTTIDSTGKYSSDKIDLTKYDIAQDSDFLWRDIELGEYNDRYLGDFDKGVFVYVGTDKYVILPETIQGYEPTSYRSMFIGTGVKGVYSNSDKITNMYCMFKDTDLKEFDLDTSNVTDFSYMFQETNNFTLDVSGINTSSATIMLAMFKDSKATSIKGLETFDTSNVNSMFMMFSGSNFRKLDLRSFDTSKVASMTQMFENSKVTELLGLEDFKTDNVYRIRKMFENSLLDTVDLSSFNLSEIADITDVFNGSRIHQVIVSSEQDIDTLRLNNQINNREFIVKNND